MGYIIHVRHIHLSREPSIDLILDFFTTQKIQNKTERIHKRNRIFITSYYIIANYILQETTEKTNNPNSK